MASKETIDQQPPQLQRNESVFANRTVLLNPGSSYKIEADDLCLYIALVKEENYNFKEYKYKNCKYWLRKFFRNSYKEK